MKYFTREYQKKSLNILEDGIISIDTRAKVKEDLFYQEIYQATYDRYCRDWGYELTDDEFNYILNDKTKYFNEVIPEYIIGRIADFRVAALGIVTDEIYNAIKDYNAKALNYCENARYSYLYEYEISKQYFSERCARALNCNLCDARIIRCFQNNDNIYMYFSLDTYTKNNDYDLLYIFKKGEFLELTGVIQEDEVCYSEVYALKNYVEFHILGQNSQCIIAAEDLDYRFSESYKYREGIN